MRRFFALTLGLLLSSAVVAADSEPSQAIEQFHESLLELMRAEAAFDERHERLQPVIEQRFDLLTIARISLGASWRELNEEQRQQLVDELRLLITATYADRFKRYNNHRFVTRDVTDAGQGRSLVKTELLRVNDDNVRLDYYLLEGRVFNVVADGVSDLSVRRAEYTSILRRDGFDGLIKEIRQKAADYRTANEA